MSIINLNLSISFNDFDSLILIILKIVDMFHMRRRIFLVERFIHMLIVLRVFTTSYFSLEAYVSFLFLMTIAQYYKQGLTPNIAFIVPLVILQSVGQVLPSIQLQYLAAILGGILHFFTIKVYWLPEPSKIVGFRTDVIQSDLQYFEFYPLDETEAVTFKNIKWNTGKQIYKLTQYLPIQNSLIKKCLELPLTYLDHVKLKVGEGAEEITDSGIAFCHGRGATPFIYSTILMRFAGLKYKVGAVQHHEVNFTEFENMAQIKRFREKQVQMRAAEFYQTIHKVGKSKMILMGHSYGCSTIIQAYHSLQPDMKSKITHIILLDPWLFPLSEAKFMQQINCPVLILANQDFVEIEGNYILDKLYQETHRVQYVNWRNAHHVHQTDMGFLIGNTPGKCKNSHLSGIMLDLNFQAIDRFLSGKKVEGTFGDKDLGRKFVPEKFHPKNYFTY